MASRSTSAPTPCTLVLTATASARSASTAQQRLADRQAGFRAPDSRGSRRHGGADGWSPRRARRSVRARRAGQKSGHARHGARGAQCGSIADDALRGAAAPRAAPGDGDARALARRAQRRQARLPAQAFGHPRRPGARRLADAPLGAAGDAPARRGGGARAAAAAAAAAGAPTARRRGRRAGAARAAPRTAADAAQTALLKAHECVEENALLKAQAQRCRRRATTPRSPASRRRSPRDKTISVLRDAHRRAPRRRGGQPVQGREAGVYYSS